MGFGSKTQWAYIVARVKVMKRRLLPSDEFKKLVNMDFNEVVRYLEETDYKKEIDEMSYKYEGPRLMDYALSTNLFRTYNRIAEVSFGSANDLVVEYLKRWDVWNIINIIRGKTANVPPEQIEETLIPVGEYSLEFYKSLLPKEIEEIVKTFDGTPYYDTLSKVGTTNMSEIEDELYRSYYSRMLGIRPENLALKLFLDFIRMEIDIKNIKTIFRLKMEEVPTEEITDKIISGGYQIDDDEARKLAAMPIDELKKSLDGYWFWKDIELNGDFSRVENKLDSLLIHGVAKKANGHPLSVLPVLHYMNLKKIEADNIRIIGWGKWENLPHEHIEEQLVII